MKLPPMPLPAVSATPGVPAVPAATPPAPVPKVSLPPRPSPMARPPVAPTSRQVPSVPTGRGVVRTDTHNAANQVPAHAKHKGRGM